MNGATALAPATGSGRGGQSTLLRLIVVAALVLAGLGSYGERWGLRESASIGSSSVGSVGEPAPVFMARTLAGGTASLEAFRGRVVVVNFWATWCGPCRVEMPEFERYQAQMAGQVAILGVNLQEPPSLIEPFVRQYGLTFPILLDENGTIASSYRVTGLPMSVILDRSGVVRERVIGAMTHEVLTRRVERLL